MYTPFAHAFAYAIKQTPYAFVSKIILCMYLLYGRDQDSKLRAPVATDDIMQSVAKSMTTSPSPMDPVAAPHQ